MIAEEIVARLSVESGSFTAGLAAAQGQLGAFGKSATAMGGRMQTVGKTMTAGLTVPILGLGVIAVKSAADFESAFAGVRKTVDASEPEFAALREAILDMSEVMPASAEEIAGVAEVAGQLGIQGDQIMGFTKTMIMMGEATNLSAEDAANAIARFSNIMGVASGDMSTNALNVGNAIVKLGSKGASTESEIAALSLRLAAAGRQAGFSQADVLGLAAAMGDVGIPAERGGTAMSMFLARVNTATKQGGAAVAGFARVAQMSGAKFVQAFQKDPVQATEAFLKGLDAIRRKGGDVDATLRKLGVTNRGEIDTLGRLAGAWRKVGEQNKVANNQFTDGNALTDEYEERVKTFNAQLTMFGNQFRRVAIDLGHALLPAMRSAIDSAGPLIDMLKSLAGAFVALPSGVQSAIVTFAGLAAAIGPVVWLVGSFIKAMVAIGTGVRAIVAGTAAASAAVGRFGAALTGSTAANIRAAQASQAAGIANARMAAAMTAASGGSVRVAGTATAAGAAWSRYAAQASAAVAANGRIASSSFAAAAGTTRVGTAASTAGTMAGTATAALTGFAIAMIGLNAASNGAVQSTDEMILRLREGQDLMNTPVQGENWASAFSSDLTDMSSILDRMAESQFIRFTDGLNQMWQDDSAMQNYITGLEQLTAIDPSLATAKFRELKAAMEQRGMDTSGLDNLAMMLNQAGSAADGAANSLGRLTAAQRTQLNLGAQANNAAFTASMAALRQQVNSTGASWGQYRGQLLNMAATQLQTRDMIIQTAGAQSNAADRARAAYQRQAVAMGAMVPKAQQSGRAFQTLARSAGLSGQQLAAAVQKMKSGGMSAGQALAAALRGSEGKVKNAAQNLGRGAGQGAASGLKAGQGKAKNAAQQMGNQINQAVKAAGSKVRQAAQQSGRRGGEGFASGLKSGSGKAKSAAQQLAQNVQQAVRSAGQKIKSVSQQSGKQGGEGMGKGLKESTSQARNAAEQMGQQTADALRATGSGLQAAGFEAGQMAGQGMVDGINSMAGAVAAAAQNIANAAMDTIRSALQLGSPSKITWQFGRWFTEGLAKGIMEKTGDVAQAAKEGIRSALQAARSELNRFIQEAKTNLQWIDAIQRLVQDRAAFTQYDWAGQNSNRQQALDALTQAQKDATAAGKDAWNAAVKQAQAAKAVTDLQDAYARAVRDAAAADRNHDHYGVARALAAQKAAMDALTDAQQDATSTAQELAAAQKAVRDASAAVQQAQTAVNQTPAASLRSALDAMKQQQRDAVRFGNAIEWLSKAGLDNKALQDLIQSGNLDLALALKEGGSAAVNELNKYQRIINEQGNKIADIAAVSAGRGTRRENQAVVDTQINIHKDAIKMTFGSGITKADREAIRKTVYEALDRAMERAADAAKRARHQKNKK